MTFLFGSDRCCGDFDYTSKKGGHCFFVSKSGVNPEIKKDFNFNKDVSLDTTYDK